MKGLFVKFLKYFLIFLIFSVNHTVFAKSLEKKEFIIGVQNFKYYLPYSQYSKRKYIGFNKELLLMFAQKKSYKFIFVAYPLKRLYRVFLSNKVDLKYPDNPYWNAKLKENTKIFYSDSVVEYIDGVMVKKGNENINIRGMRHLGVVAGFTPYPYLKYEKNGQLKISEEFDYKTMITKVLLERYEGIYSNIAVTKHYLNDVMHKNNELVFNANLPYVRSDRYLSSIKYPEIIEEFNNFLEVEKTRIDELKKKYKILNYLPSK